MTHEETNLRTKQLLSASLKKFMVKKPLKKITVSEIINDCNVNRKTFYYHFEDIYALLKWMLEQEAFDVVKHYDLLMDYTEAITFVMDYVEANAYMLNCVYDSTGRDELKRFFYADFNEIVKTIIDKLEKEIDVQTKEDFKAFLCDFYTEAVANLLISMFKENKRLNREKTLEYFYLTIYTSMVAVLKEAPKQE